MILNCKPYYRTVVNFLLFGILSSRSLASPSKESLADNISSHSAEGDTSFQLYVDVFLNQMPVKQLTTLIEKQGELYMTHETLTGLGITLPKEKTDLIALKTLPSIHYRYDANKLQLTLTVPAELLTAKPQIYTQHEETHLPTNPSAMGVLFNYSAFTSNWQSQPQSSLWSEVRLLGLPHSTLSNSMQSQLTQQDKSNIRLDTLWSYDIPDSMLNLSVGDTLTKSVDWSRSTRIGGIQISRDFSLQPYFNTAPLASFVGSATLPSDVDLYINGIKNSSQQVSPGQFQLQGIPIVNGAGQATMTITDVTGQTQSVSFNLYGTPQLLRKGLLDWSTEIGFVRQDWGIESFSYAPKPMISATTRYGVTNTLTLESHGEADQQIKLLGIGGIGALPYQLGVFNTALAYSQQKKNEEQPLGKQWQFGYNWNNNHYNFTLSTLRSDTQYRDIASQYGADPISRKDQAFAGVSTPLGQWSTGYILQQTMGQTRSRFISLNWSQQFKQMGSVYISFNQQTDNKKALSSNISWSIPLNEKTYLNSALNRSKGNNFLSIDAVKNSRRIGEVGWRVQATSNNLSHHNFQGELHYNNPYGEWGLGAGYWLNDSTNNAVTTYGSANGGVLFMDNQFFAMRAADDAFALVSTNGTKDVPVKLENRVVGYTDNKGYFLINDLNANQHNLVAIDPLNLPLDVSIGKTVFDVIPDKRSGTIVHFDIKQQSTLLLSLKTEKGSNIPVGNAVWLVTSAKIDYQKIKNTPEITQIGYDGTIYLSAPPQDSRLIVELDADHYCQVSLSALLPHLANVAQVTLCRFAN